MFSARLQYLCTQSAVIHNSAASAEGRARQKRSRNQTVTSPADGVQTLPPNQRRSALFVLGVLPVSSASDLAARRWLVT